MRVGEGRELFSLAIKNAHLKFSNFSLDIDSFELPAGSTTALMGPSGSGKTVLVNLLGMLENVGSAEIYLDGKLASAKDIHGRVTAVFQRPFLMKGTVFDNVAYGLKIKRTPRSEVARRVKDVLDLVGLSGYARRSVAGLSGGEAQRVALARALVLEPSALLLDEPLASVDASLRRQLSHEFARILHELSITAVYVTHDVDEALIVSDFLAIIMNGRIVAHGPSREVVSIVGDPNVAKFLGTDLAFSGTVESVDGDLATIDCFFESITAPSSGLFSGQRVLVALRPEDVICTPSADSVSARFSGWNRFRGTLVSVELLGSSFRYIVENSGVRISSTMSLASNSLHAMAPGSLVDAFFAPQTVQAVPADLIRC